MAAKPYKVLVAWVALAGAIARADRGSVSADDGWRFHLGEVAWGEKGSTDDSAWENVRVPHDWSILGDFSANNPTGAAGGFLPSGIGWYRRSFTLPAGASPSARWRVEFDGVMANSDVWLNGEHLGHRTSGSVSFGYDISAAVHRGAGATNVLAVRVDTSREPASRWYTGAGIYRHVRLIATDAVHFVPHSIAVRTTNVSAAAATVEVSGEIENDTAEAAEVLPAVAIHRDNAHETSGTASIDAAPEAGPLSIAAGAKQWFSKKIHLSQPALWTPGSPSLYVAKVSLLRSAMNTSDPVTGPTPPRAIAAAAASTADASASASAAPEDSRHAAVTGAVASASDSEAVTFGVREFHFDAATGFWINGRNLKLKGVCLHDDVSALGAAAPLESWARRLRVLQSLGANAIRTAHNPPDPGFLDLCDRMGFLVMDEFFDTWNVGKEPYDYHLVFADQSDRDQRDTLLRDRNHPSIILWSVGNEIHDTPDAASAKRILRRLVDACHELDPTRPVTQALFRPNVSHDYDNGLADLLDVIGTNYRFNELLAAQAAKPSRLIVGTENRRSREEWLGVVRHPSYSGEFVWTGVDYLGEAGRWPTVAAGSGLIDRTATPRASGYEFASWWSERPMVKAFRRTSPPRPPAPGDPGYGGPVDANLRYPQILFPDWTPAESAPHTETVEVYSNAETVRLRLNGRDIDAPQPRHENLSARVWHLPFAAGTLEAVALDQGREVARDVLRTAGPAARVQLKAEHPHLSGAWESPDYIEATVVDAAGTTVPSAAQTITFAATGPAGLLATDSGDNQSHERFASPSRRAFHGTAWAILRGTGHGDATLTAQADGLAPATLTLPAE